MRAHFNNELNRLMGMLQSMMSDVLRNVEDAVRAVEGWDAALAARIGEQDKVIDEAEVRIEEECLKILALHQPVADDLRFVFNIAKTNKELERIGDLAVKIAESALAMVQSPETEIPADLRDLLDRSRKLVQKSMSAFAGRDAAAALIVWQSDAEVDRLRDVINLRIEQEMQKYPAAIPRLRQLYNAVAALERMADHGVNIAKDVIYLVEGRIVRHQDQAHASASLTPPVAPLNVIGQKQHVLFICVHNSARSQMAAAWLNALHGDRFVADSAGLTAGKLNPLAVSVMQEAGIDISKNLTQDVFSLVRKGNLYSYVITVCDETNAERCPIFVGITRRLHWSFADPSSFTGAEDEKLQKTREVRDAIRQQVDKWATGSFSYREHL